MAPDGSVTDPIRSFTSDPDTGSYSGGANVYGIATGGNNAGKWTDSTGTFQVYGGSGLIDVAKFRRSTANSGIDVEGNRSAASTSEDVRIASLATRTAGTIMSVENPGATIVAGLRSRWDGRQMYGVPNSAPVDADLNASNVTAYLNEAGNLLLFRVKYADGATLKLGTVALV